MIGNGLFGEVSRHEVRFFAGAALSAFFTIEADFSPIDFPAAGAGNPFFGAAISVVNFDAC